MFQNRTAEKKKIPAVNVLFCSYTHFEFSLFSWNNAVLCLSPGMPLFNYLPIPLRPHATKWRKPLQTWEPHPYPAVQQDLCSTPTCKTHPPRWRPHHTDSQRTSGEDLNDGPEKRFVSVWRAESYYLYSSHTFNTLHTCILSESSAVFKKDCSPLNMLAWGTYLVADQGRRSASEVHKVLAAVAQCLS